jgi:aminopeptidase N
MYQRASKASSKKDTDNRPTRRQRGLRPDMYFKGALFLNTLRSIVNNDQKWFALIRDVFQHFKYQNIMTEDVSAYMNQRTGLNLTPVFDQYLRHTAVPKLELKFDETAHTFSYRWKADVLFAMPSKSVRHR